MILTQKYLILSSNILTQILLYKISLINALPQLLHNSSVYLGTDSDDSHYYFFLHDPTRVFYKNKSNVWKQIYQFFILSLLMQSFLNSSTEIEKQCKGLNNKDVKNQSLKANLQIILKSGLFETTSDIDTPKGLDTSIQTETSNNNEQMRKRIIDTSLLFEFSLSDQLEINNGRWIIPEDRKNFRLKLQQAIQLGETQFLECVAELLAKFLERTVTQERLEQRKDTTQDSCNENEGDMDLEELDDDIPMQQIKTQRQDRKNKRQVVEDESEEQIQIVISEFMQLEQMDPKKIQIRKLPLKLFGSLNDNLRLCCSDLVKSHLSSYGDLLLVVIVLEQIVNDYVERKRDMIQEKEKPREFVNHQQNNGNGYNQDANTKSAHYQTVNQQEVTASEQKNIKPKQDQQQNQQSQLRSNRTRQSSRPQYFEGSDTQWEEQCKICHQRGKVVCCDTCTSVFHSKCLGLKQIPVGKWSCFRCLSRMEAQIKTRATLKKLQS